MSAQIILFPIGEYSQLPFSSFRDAPLLRDSGLTVGDLHDGASIGSSPTLRHWLMGFPRVRHTMLTEIRDWIDRRHQKAMADEWVQRIMAAPPEVQDIERLVT